MSKESPIKVLIVGFSGLIGKRHTKHVQENPLTDLVAVVDPSPTAAQVASSLGISDVPIFSSIKALLASTDIGKPEAAIVCTPNHTHVPVASELVEAGIHVLVEKPISSDVESGQSLVELAENRGVKLLVGHHRRFNPYIIATKGVIDSGRLGSVTAISGIWTLSKPDSYFNATPIEAWRKSRSRGGGVVLINLIHEIDNLQFLFGPIVRIHAEETVRRRSGDDDDTAEEGAALILCFESGVVGTFILSDAVASPHNFEMSSGENPTIPPVRYQRSNDPVDVYRVFGTEGTLSVPDMNIWAYAKGTEKSWTQPMIQQKVEIDTDPRVPFERQLDHFIRVVKGTEEPSCTGEQGLRALKICNDIRDAIRRK